MSAQTTFQPFPKIPRLFRQAVITEKIDGTNAAVVLVPYQQADVDQLPFSLATVPDPAHGMYLSVLAQSRSRYLTAEQDNFGFAAWVKAHAEELAALGPGVHFGEWWGKGIQRGYGLDEKRFSLFNVSRWYGAEGPRPVSEPLARHAPECCDVVPVISAGVFCESLVEDAVSRLAGHGSFAAPGYDNPEGICIYHDAAGHYFKITFDGDGNKGNL
jgi:hypothetical protein